MHVSVDKWSTAEDKLEDLSEKNESFVLKSTLLEEENRFIPGLSEEVQKLRKSLAKSEDKRIRALERINVIERQNYEMYSSSVKRTELLEKENNSTIKEEKGQD